MQHNAYVFLCENMVWFVNIHDQMLYNFISIFVVQCCHIVPLASNEVIKKKGTAESIRRVFCYFRELEVYMEEIKSICGGSSGITDSCMC